MSTVLTHPFKNVSGRAEGDLGWGDHPLNSGRHRMGKNCGNQVGRKTYRKCAPEYPANNRSWCPWEGMTRLYAGHGYAHEGVSWLCSWNHAWAMGNTHDVFSTDIFRGAARSAGSGFLRDTFILRRIAQDVGNCFDC